MFYNIGPCSYLIELFLGNLDQLKIYLYFEMTRQVLYPMFVERL